MTTTATATSHQQDAVDSLILVVVVLVATFISNTISTKKWQKYLPESGAAMIFGIFVGGIFRIMSWINVEHEFKFAPEAFYFILLPPIIFEAGYSMSGRDFFANITTILFYAVFGTLISALVVGYGLFAFVKYGLITSISSNDALVCLQFGALISATDPVATLSIMGSPELRVQPLIYSLIFGESVLNDAIAIVLFRTFSGFEGKSDFAPTDALAAVGQFFLISFGSILIGVGIGLVACWILKKMRYLREQPHMEVSVLLLTAYASYLVAEMAGLSGVMSLFLNGIILKHYAWYTLSEEGRVTSHQFFLMLSFLTETFVFVYVGINVFATRLEWDAVLIVWAMILILIARVFNIVPMSVLANTRRKNKVTWRMQFMLWFAGLRGAIAFALSQTIQSASRTVIVTTTLFIVLVTTLGMGCATAPLLKKLQLQTPPKDDHHDIMLLESIDLEDHQVTEQARVQARPSRSVVHYYWRKFDERFMKPNFGGKPRRTLAGSSSSSSTQ